MNFMLPKAQISENSRLAEKRPKTAQKGPKPTFGRQNTPKTPIEAVGKASRPQVDFFLGFWAFFEV